MELSSLRGLKALDLGIFYSGITTSAKKTTGNREPKVKVSYPGKFAPSTIPILDYAVIADGLYRQEFKSLINNKNPDQFDLYESIPDVEVAEGRKYQMLLYKVTKILHTYLHYK